MKTLGCAVVAAWLAGWCGAQQPAEEPLYWDFYRRQEIREMPVLEYDDVAVPYREVLEPEHEKVDASPVIVESTSAASRTAGFRAGVGSQAFLRFRRPDGFGVTEGGWEITAAPLSDGNAEHRVNVSLHRTVMSGATVVDVAARFAAGCVESWVSQTVVNCSVVQYAAPGLRFSYRPVIRFLHARDSGFQKLFVDQEFRVAYAPSYTGGGSLVVVPVSLDGRRGIGYGAETLVRDLPWSGAGGTLRVMVQDIGDRPHTSGVYHAATLSQRIRRATVGVCHEHTYDTGYVDDYFLRWADAALEHMRHEGDDGHTTGIPDVRRSALFVSYEREPTAVRLSAERLEYSAYPAYEWSGALVPVMAGPHAFNRLSGAAQVSPGRGLVVRADGWSVVGGPPPCMPGYRIECRVSREAAGWSSECTVLHEGGVAMARPSDHRTDAPGPAAELAAPRTLLRATVGIAVSPGVVLEIHGALPLAGRAFATPVHAREPEVSCGIRVGW